MSKFCFLKSVISKRENADIFESIEESIEYIKKGGSKYEKLEENDITKLYFDFDYKIEVPQYLDIKQLDYTKEIMEKHDININKLCDEFQVDKKNIAVAQRHRFIQNNTLFKISWRYWILGFKIHYMELKQIATKLGFDDAIYNKKQVLGCIYNHKDYNDFHSLTPYSKHEVYDYIAKYVKDDYKLITYKKKIIENNNKSDILPNYSKNNIILFSTAEKLINYINSERAYSRKSWSCGMWALIELSRANDWSDDMTTNIIHNFSKRACNYDFEATEKFIEDFLYKKHDNPVGLGTLKEWLYDDNKEKYNELFNTYDKDYRNALNDVFIHGATNFNVAKFMKITMPNYVFTGDNLYYKDEYYKYKLIDQKILDCFLAKSIYNIIKPKIISFINKNISNLKSKDQTPEVVDCIEKSQKKLSSTKRSLDTNQFIKNCADAFKTICLDSDLEKKMNSDLNLIGFNNGVYDLNTHKFRLPLDNEFVSLSTLYDYKVDDDFQEIEEFIDTSSYNTDCAYHRKKRLGSLLQAGNISQKAIFKTGVGSNGKSVENTILKTGLGKYVANIPYAYWAERKKNPEKPEPFLINLKHVLVAITNEGDVDNPIVSGVFKSLTGSDELSARQMYSKVIEEFRPHFTPVIYLNNLPKFTENNYAEIRRIEVDVYPFSFVPPEEFDETNINHKKIIIGLESKFKNYGNKTFNFLIKYYKLFIKEGLSEPKFNRDETLEYRKDLDLFKSWKIDCIKHQIAARTQCADLLESYKVYTEDNKIIQRDFLKKLKASGVLYKRINGSYYIHDHVLIRSESCDNDSD